MAFGKTTSLVDKVVALIVMCYLAGGLAAVIVTAVANFTGSGLFLAASFGTLISILVGIFFFKAIVGGTLKM